MAKKCVALIACALLVVALAGGAVAARNGETVRVLVGFNGAPDAALVAAAGGTVHCVYDIVPALAATLPAAAADGLARNPRVAYVEPDGVAYAMTQVLPWNIDYIDAELVWPSGNQGQGVNLCVLDTGVDIDHPDLFYRGGYDFVNGDNNPDDDHGHGTHITGIAAALNNDIGVVGTAPRANLYAVKVLNSSGSGSISMIVSGLNWAVNNHMNVVNMSLGTPSNYTTLRTACDNAWNAGLVLTSVAGAYPGKYTSVIAVTGCNLLGEYTGPSDPTNELTAPSTNIYSTWGGGGYGTLSGLSCACPHVAGVAALVWSAHPSVSNQYVRDAMDSAATDAGPVGWDQFYGWGIVNAPRAVAYHPPINAE